MQGISGSRNKKTWPICRGIGTLLHDNAFETKKYQLKIEPQHKHHNSLRLLFCGRVSVLSLTQLIRGFKELTAIVLNRGRISSVGSALDCRAGGGRFDSRGWTNAHGLKITEK